MSDTTYWRSAYTGIVHVVDEYVGHWAYVLCMRASIPGETVDAEDIAPNDQCPKCDLLAKQREWAQRK